MPSLNKRDIRSELLTRGVENVVDRNHLEKALSSGKKLRVKFGIDPTGRDLHLGHAVVLRKLRDFQSLGHTVVLIIGDFTGMIGDPSGRSTERVVLSEKDIERNMKEYLTQVGKIIDVKKAEVRYNSEWLGKNVKEILELAKAGTVQQVMQREDFRDRIDKGLTILETLYPLLQGYDSVKVRADVELGGRDQLLNLLMGRQVQKHFGMKEQDILTVPLIEGTDGVNKMSKSKGNYIGLNEKPLDMFGKAMSINDSQIVKFFTLCTDVSMGEIKMIEKALAEKKQNPRDIKLKLAEEIVRLYHGDKMAKVAGGEFVKIFQKKEAPTKIKTIKISKDTLADVLVLAKIAPSKSAANRLISQGAVKVNDVKVLQAKAALKNGDIIKSGKRHFIRISI